MTARDSALAAWVRKVARNPNEPKLKDMEKLRAAGFSAREIFEATSFIAFRIAFSTLNDALGARPDWQLADAAPPDVRSRDVRPPRRRTHAVSAQRGAAA
jgi:hypothetical protein